MEYDIVLAYRKYSYAHPTIAFRNLMNPHLIPFIKTKTVFTGQLPVPSTITWKTNGAFHPIYSLPRSVKKFPK